MMKDTPPNESLAAVLKQARVVSYWRGAWASLSVLAVGFGLKSLGVSDFWSMLAPLSLIAAWVVGFAAAILHVLENDNH